MPRTATELIIKLDRIACYDENDGSGTAEPYLWPVFFKIDGSSYAVTTSGFIGSPTIIPTFGTHGNLGTRDVDAGNNVTIPAALGEFRTLLQPIPVLDSFRTGILGSDTIPGLAGVVYILMEEDGWSNSLATEGYSAMIEAIQLAITQVTDGFRNALSQPTKDQIERAMANVKGTAARMIRDHIISFMGVDSIWYATFGDNDDQIGANVNLVDNDAIERDLAINFNHRWDEQGSWEIFGSFSCVRRRVTYFSSTQHLFTRILESGLDRLSLCHEDATNYRWTKKFYAKQMTFTADAHNYNSPGFFWEVTQSNGAKLELHGSANQMVSIKADVHVNNSGEWITVPDQVFSIRISVNGSTCSIENSDPANAYNFTLPVKLIVKETASSMLFSTANLTVDLVCEDRSYEEAYYEQIGRCIQKWTEQYKPEFEIIPKGDPDWRILKDVPTWYYKKDWKTTLENFNLLKTGLQLSKALQKTNIKKSNQVLAEVAKLTNVPLHLLKPAKTKGVKTQKEEIIAE